MDKYFCDAVDVEKASWKGTKGTALAMNSKLRSFFSNYLKSACQSKIVRIFFYKINNENAAMLIGLEVPKKFLVLKMGYNKSWAKYSPGLNLTNETIKYAFHKKINFYEFLGSLEDWQKIWPGCERSYSTIAYYPYTLSGIIKFLFEFFNYVYKKIRN